MRTIEANIPETTRRRAVLSTWCLALGALLGTGCYDGASAHASPDDDGVGDSGGSDDEPPPELGGGGSCVDIDHYFRDEVWSPVLKEKCYACHNPTGTAKHTDLVLQGSDYPGYLEANLQTVQNVARLEIDGTSLLLLKPSAQVDHTGGKQIEQDGDEFERLSELIERFDAPVHCVDDADVRAFYADLALLDPQQTLRKATFMLAGRLPTQDEIDGVEALGMNGLAIVLEGVTREDAFYNRLIEIYNDILHTDAYLASDDAIDTIDTQRFPNARWFDALPDDQQGAARNATNAAVAREPLELIRHVVKHELPFTYILTANYVMVNPWSARSYDVPMSMFANPDDPKEFVPVTFADFPHAGLLTTSVFLNRYPTTPTNRNRARSRVVFDFFLGTDVLRLAARPIDVTAVEDFNPTLYNPNCNVCHDNVDPMAGAFQGFDERGRYRPMAEGWYADMRPPGFDQVDIPFGESARALQWITPWLIRDRKFAMSVVYAMYRGLTGQEPLVEPLDEDAPDYLERIRAFRAQDHSFGEIADHFVASGHDIRAVVQKLVVSEWFRAVDATVPLTDRRASELADLGSARLLSPELLHRRIVATTGVAWRRGTTNVLLSSNYFKFFYGGIDSASVTTRLTEMNGVMANIAERMANEVACTATAFDFTKAPADRLLMPLVEPTDLPESPGGTEAIRANIVHLHDQLLGEQLADDDHEVDRTLALFEAVLADGRARMLDADAPLSSSIAAACAGTVDPATGTPVPEGTEIVEDPDYTVRAWMAVITYLLGDHRFLYE